MDGVVDQEDSGASYEGIFIGDVVFNEDPDECERIKVTIPNLFEGDPANLPWVGKEVADKMPDARDGSFGTFGLVPPIGTQVIVYFQGGDPLYPMYCSYPHQKDERVAEAKGADYKYVYGHKDPAGNLFLVNTKPGSNFIKVRHASGTQIQIDNGGNLSITVSGSTAVVSAGPITMTAPSINMN